MVSPGELRLVETLAETDAFEPEIADDGAVSYPDARRHLDDDDDDPTAILERFTTRGLLSSEFVSKVYVCTECATEGMQYITVCPSCDSPRAVETKVLEHGCGYVGSRSTFDAENGFRCPECETALEADDVDETERYVCEDCAGTFETPDSRLWCRECRFVTPPQDAIERVLYRYSLTPEGSTWLDHQTGALRTVSEALAERRFETTIDATVGDGDDARSVHVLAEDELMGERRIVSLQETPDEEHVDAFCAFAESIGAHPVVVTTSGVVEDEVAARADRPGLTVLAVDGNGGLDTTYETVESANSGQGFFSRLSAAIEVPIKKSQR